MKMIFVVFNISIQEEVHDAIEKLGVSCYTQWPRLLGKGVSTGPKLDDNIWPGANSALLIVVDDKMAEKVMATIQGIRDEIGKYEGIKAFQLDVEKMTGDI
jgi:nitrogen regulatory protein PII